MSKPNLLFIFTDEQRYDTLSAYGNDMIQMPNLNRLAEQSTVFDRAYVSEPVCTPSRATIMTGLYPHTNGCVHNTAFLSENIRCLPELLSSEDYKTAYFGKWHLGDEIFAQHGFQEWVATEGDNYRKAFREGRDKNALAPYDRFVRQQGYEPENGFAFDRYEAASLPEEVSKPAFLGQEVSRFIRENADQPFIAYVNFLEPHGPFFGPRDDQYAPENIPLPENFEARPGPENHMKERLIAAYYEKFGVCFETRNPDQKRPSPEITTPLDSEQAWRRYIAKYWGLCSLVDTHAGQMLDTLEKCGLWDNTIIVFTSDHGSMMGSHGMAAKSVMFDESTRVPLLVKGVNQKQQRSIKQPVSQVDLVPTLIDMLGDPIPDNLHGKSRKDVLTDENRTMEDDVFIEWTCRASALKKCTLPDGSKPYPESLKPLASREEAYDAITDPLRTVVTPEGWKFNFSPRRGEHELFNLNQDPLEIRNLAGDKGQKKWMQELRKRIQKAQSQVHDLVELPAID